MIYVSIVYEDDLSELVMTKLLDQFQHKYYITNTYSGHGFGYLKANIKGFNEASVESPYFMLTDLDNYECPLSLIQDWVDFVLNPNFIFRIAVKEVESWLLADVDGLANFMKVSKANFPLQPDNVPDPKNKLIQIARKSRIRRIREDIVPINEYAQIGPNYNGCLSEFVFYNWDIKQAIMKSTSLQRAYNRLEKFSPV